MLKWEKKKENKTATVNQKEHKVIKHERKRKTFRNSRVTQLTVKHFLFKEIPGLNMRQGTLLKVVKKQCSFIPLPLCTTTLKAEQE